MPMLLKNQCAKGHIDRFLIQFGNLRCSGSWEVRLLFTVNDLVLFFWVFKQASWLSSDLTFILPKGLIFHAVRLQHLEAISVLAGKDVSDTMRCNCQFCYLTFAFFKDTQNQTILKMYGNFRFILAKLRSTAGLNIRE